MQFNLQFYTNFDYLSQNQNYGFAHFPKEMILRKTPAWWFECDDFKTAETRSWDGLYICGRLQAAPVLAVFLRRQATLSSSVAAFFFLPGLLLGPLSIPTCCWNIVCTLSITVPRGPTNSPGSAGSELRKYTPLINVVAALQGKSLSVSHN